MCSLGYYTKVFYCLLIQTDKDYQLIGIVCAVCVVIPKYFIFIHLDYQRLSANWNGMCIMRYHHNHSDCLGNHGTTSFDHKTAH